MCLSEVDLSVGILRGVVDLGIGPCYLSLRRSLTAVTILARFLKHTLFSYTALTAASAVSKAALRK